MTTRKLVKRSRFRGGLAFAAGVFLTAFTGFGATIYDNGAPNNLGGNGLSDFAQADDFVISSLANLTAVRFWSMELSPADYSGSIFWEIRDSVLAAPGATVLGSGTASPIRTPAGAALGLNIFQNDFTISVNLPASTYWLVLHNGPLSNTAFTDYYWAWTNIGGANAGTNRGVERSLDPPDVNWSTNQQEHAFLISAEAAPNVPEPASFVLVSAGVAALAMSQRRFRKGGK